MPQNDVVIVGAGVAGLASASFLRRVGYGVTVLEQATSLGPVGAGILLPPAGQSVLRDLGVLDQITAESAAINYVRAETSTGERLLDLKYETLSPSLRALGTPRSVLFDALRNGALEAGARIIPKARVNGIESTSEGVKVRTDDGVERTARFAVVADGSRSSIGDALGLRRFRIDYSHEAIWTTGEMNNPTQDYLLQRLDGVRRLSGLLPLGNGKASFFWGVHQSEQFTDREGFRREAMALIPEATQIINRLASDGNCARTGYRTTLHYPWHRGNIVLLGDAAHSMSPHLGQGASLALLDSVRLASALRDSDGEISKAFASYQRDRFWKSLYYVSASLATSPFFQSKQRLLAPLRNFALPFLQRFPWIERQMVSTMSGMKSKIFKTQMNLDELRF